MKSTESVKNVKLRWAARPLDKARAAELVSGFVMALMLGRVRILGGLSPFGAAFVGAAPQGAPAGVTALGVCLGVLSAGGLSWRVKYIAIAVLVWAVLHFFAHAAPGWFPMAVSFGVSAVIGFVFAWDTGWQVRATALYIVECFLAGGCVWFYTAALSPWDDRAGRSARNARAASLTVLIATLLMSLSTVSLFGILSLGRFAAVLAVLFVTLRGGTGMGCVTAAALGAAMDLAQGGMPFFVLSYILSALAAGIFSKNSRLTYLLAWVGTSALTVLWVWPHARWLPALYESFAASVIFLLLPDELLAKLAVFLPSEAPGVGFMKAREYARDRVELCAEAFRGLYDTVRTQAGDTPAEDTAEIFDRAADAVCRACPHSARCWQERYLDTVDVMNHLTPALLDQGSVDLAALPERFTQDCGRAEALVAAINAEARTFLTRRQYRARLQESRGAAFGQYNDVSLVLRSLARELGGEITVEPTLERSLQKYLRGLAMDASVAVFRVRGGRLRADIRSRSLELLRRDKLWLDRLSEVLGTRLCTSEADTDPDRLILLEAEPLAVHVGLAGLKKSGEAVSGDKCVYFRTDEGMLYVLLSDGMGSGEEAARTSSGAAQVLERFLRAGIGPELALGILSDLMLLKNDAGLESATVDLLAMDMFSGDAALYKFGAAPSYVRKGSSLRRITGGPLPVGFKSGPARPAAKTALTPGTLALMTSDGVSPAPDDRWLRKLLTDFEGDDVKLLARSVLDAAADHGAAGDDMTVLAIAVEQRK